ncbi:MAG: right-handed parallel beta-helix repeat-containing protein [Candidatus Acetothermia bacterium]|nr:right-handed parallel beta-helix repeat-containing protein [Candidatus Acetothermia bacterium]
MQRTVMLAGVLLLALLLSSYTGRSPGLATTERVPHMPIVITGDEGFTPENGVTGGSGTEEDPYIIQNWLIDARYANGISVEGTEAHFVIRNCEIQGDIREGFHSGILLTRVRNGVIEKTIIASMSGHGVFLDEASDVRIEANSIHNNDRYGIALSASPNITMLGNDIVANRVGIHLAPIGVEGVEYGSVQNEIRLNYVRGPSVHGIALYKGASNNTVDQNWIESCFIGIWVQAASGNTLSGNNVRESGYNGITIGAGGNSIIHNNLLGSRRDNAFDTGLNQWDDGLLGNYWHDYGAKYPHAACVGAVWNTPYGIPGGRNADNHPLCKPMVCLRREAGKPGVKPCS